MGVGPERPLSCNCPQQHGSAVGVPRDQLLLDEVLGVVWLNGSSHWSDTAPTSPSAVTASAIPDHLLDSDRGAVRPAAGLYGCRVCSLLWQRFKAPYMFLHWFPCNQVPHSTSHDGCCHKAPDGQQTKVICKRCVKTNNQREPTKNFSHHLKQMLLWVLNQADKLHWLSIASPNLHF